MQSWPADKWSAKKTCIDKLVHTIVRTSMIAANLTPPLHHHHAHHNQRASMTNEELQNKINNGCSEDEMENGLQYRSSGRREDERVASTETARQWYSEQWREDTNNAHHISTAWVFHDPSIINEHATVDKKAGKGRNRKMKNSSKGRHYRSVELSACFWTTTNNLVETKWSLEWERKEKGNRGKEEMRAVRMMVVSNRDGKKSEPTRAHLGQERKALTNLFDSSRRGWKFAKTP
ncbi:hypothetical protein C8J56DRAFT_1026907 [Mycena floridula]|nr:hypothetical protein C8J56DRAFT_1026907 [Mycena floridula]